MKSCAVGLADKKATPSATHRFPDFVVILQPFVCVLTCGRLCNHEHAALLWLLPEELATLDWAKADWPVIAKYSRERQDGGVLTFSSVYQNPLGIVAGTCEKA